MNKLLYCIILASIGNFSVTKTETEVYYAEEVYPCALDGAVVRPSEYVVILSEEEPFYVDSIVKFIKDKAVSFADAIVISTDEQKTYLLPTRSIERVLVYSTSKLLQDLERGLFDSLKEKIECLRTKDNTEETD